MSELWICVSRDKYELPMVVADSVEELATICGVKVQSIRSMISHHKKDGTPTKYYRVEVEEGV